MEDLHQKVQQLKAIDQMAAEASENLLNMSYNDINKCFKRIRLQVSMPGHLPPPEEEPEQQQLPAATPKKTIPRVKTATRRERHTVATDTVRPKIVPLRNKPTSIPKKK